MICAAGLVACKDGLWVKRGLALFTLRIQGIIIDGDTASKGQLYSFNTLSLERSSTGVPPVRTIAGITDIPRVILSSKSKIP